MQNPPANLDLPDYFQYPTQSEELTKVPFSDRESPTVLRELLLGLVIFGIVGLIIELILLDHTDSLEKWIPLVVLGISLLASIGVAIRPGPRMVRFFQGSMVLCVAAGALGLYFHYRGNVEFEIERDSSLHGLRLVWEAVRGATPTLAPGALAQLGLLGLIYSYGHPALRGRDVISSSPLVT